MENAVAERAANPFQQHPIAAAPTGALANAEQHRAVAETQAAMVIAKRFPRDQVQAMDRILQAFTRPSLAEAAMYSYARGGTDITGPSIRSAEAMAQMWGNIQFGIRELSQANGESEVEAFAWDVETNTRQVKVFKVPHVRYTKQNGNQALRDPRDIYEMVANQGGRRLRACILGIIPGDVVEAAMTQAEVTLRTKAEVTPERLKALLEKFADYGVTQDQIEKRIQRRLDAITPALLVQLGKVYNSLKDGMSKPGDWFEAAAEDPAKAGAAAAQQTGVAGAKEAVKQRRASAAQDVNATGTGDAKPAAQPATGGAPTIKDALALVNKKDYDSARDIVKGMGENPKAEIEAAIKRHQATGEQV